MHGSDATGDVVRERRIAVAIADAFDPRALWPDLDIDAYEAAIGRIANAARDVLAHRSVAWEDVDDAVARHLGRAAFRLGVGPLVGWWIEADAVRTTPAVATVFAEHLAHSRRRRARLVAETARVVEAFLGAGVEPVLLKGLDAASLYPHPAARVFQDIDLYVPPPTAMAAEDALRRLGFALATTLTERRTWAPSGGSRVASLDLTHADTSWSLDLHLSLARTLWRAVPAPIPPPDLGRCPWLELDGLRVRVLPPLERLGFVAVHASSNLRALQLLHLLDVIHASRAYRAGAAGDWSDLAAWLRGWNGERFVYPALALAERLAPGTTDPAFLAALEPRVPARLVQGMARWEFADAVRPDRWSVDQALMWAATPGEALRILWAQVVPGSGYTWRERADFYVRRVRQLVRGNIRLTGRAAPA